MNFYFFGSHNGTFYAAHTNYCASRNFSYNMPRSPTIKVSSVITLPSNLPSMRTVPSKASSTVENRIFAHIGFILCHHLFSCLSFFLPHEKSLASKIIIFCCFPSIAEFGPDRHQSNRSQLVFRHFS